MMSSRSSFGLRVDFFCLVFVGGVELGDNVIDQGVAIGELRRRLWQCVAGDGNEPLAFPIGFNGHAVAVRHGLLAVHLGTGAGDKNAQPGAAVIST
jgi:hypothetical protein